MWQVTVSRRAAKSVERLPDVVKAAIVALLREIEIAGPVRGNWPNYGKLGHDRHHCHVKRGHPTYVAVWEVKNRRIRLVEVTYVGTHEGAPY